MKNVTTYRTETPQRVATTVVPEHEDDNVWGVACEGGCERVMNVSKKRWEPNNLIMGAMPPKVITYTEVTVTAPGARCCAICGPFPRDEA